MIPLQQFAFISAGASAAAPVQVAFGAAGAGAASGGGAGVVSPAYPTGITAGMVLIAHGVARDASSAFVGTPSGWTSIDSRTIAATHASRVMYKIASGSESGNLDISVGDSVNAFGRVYRFSVGSGVESASGQTNASSSTTMPCTDVTSTVDLAIAVQCFWAQVNTTIGNVSGESGGDYTEAVAEYTATQAIMSLQVATLATAGSITGGSATLGSTGANRITHAFVIKP